MFISCMFLNFFCGFIMNMSSWKPHLYNVLWYKYKVKMHKIPVWCQLAGWWWLISWCWLVTCVNGYLVESGTGDYNLTWQNSIRQYWKLPCWNFISRGYFKFRFQIWKNWVHSVLHLKVTVCSKWDKIHLNHTSEVKGQKRKTNLLSNF